MKNRNNLNLNIIILHNITEFNKHVITQFSFLFTQGFTVHQYTSYNTSTLDTCKHTETRVSITTALFENKIEVGMQKHDYLV